MPAPKRAPRKPEPQPLVPRSLVFPAVVLGLMALLVVWAVLDLPGSGPEEIDPEQAAANAATFEWGTRRVVRYAVTIALVLGLGWNRRGAWRL